MSITFRMARLDDVGAIVGMLADDPLGAARERLEEPVAACYVDAFRTIDGDAHNELIVAEEGGRVVGCLQLTFLVGLSRQGAWRAQIEGVRVDGSMRGRGLGRDLFSWAIERARKRGCTMVQLTTDKSRGDAHRFYERLGFVASHEGMKLAL